MIPPNAPRAEKRIPLTKSPIRTRGTVVSKALSSNMSSNPGGISSMYSANLSSNPWKTRLFTGVSMISTMVLTTAATIPVKTPTMAPSLEVKGVAESLRRSMP